MTTTFEDAKIGDLAWDIRSGWGEIRDAGSHDRYSISVYFPNDEFKTYTAGGLYAENDITQSLFWDEVVIEAPAKPVPVLQVDARVLVWNGGIGKYKRHFSHHGFNGAIVCFNGGLTSWFGDKNLEEWANWELAE